MIHPIPSGTRDVLPDEMREIRAISERVRQSFEAAGYGETFGHGLGHGIGLEVHEAPRLGRTSADELKDDMVFTIEPGIYIPEEKIGVRIEDIFLVGADGKLACLSCKIPKAAEDVEKTMAQ